MTPRFYPLLVFGMGLLLLAALPFLATAADHSEAPGTQVDPAADIADLYAWHQGDELVAVLTFAGGPLAGVPTGGKTQFDDEVLYTVHIDNDGDNLSDIQVHTRFGQNPGGRWGVLVENLPGAKRPRVFGPADAVFGAGGGLDVFAGSTDDPFFFDSEGFSDTLTTGTIAFDSSRDSFAGLNVSAIVLEMDLAAASAGSETISIWATTGRLP